MRARVAVVVSRDGLAEPILHALKHSPAVESCERIPADPLRFDAAAFSHDVVIYSPVPPDGTGTEPDIAATRAIFDRLASLPLKQALLISSAAVYAPNHQHTGLLAETSFIGGTRNSIADAWREVERLSEVIGQRSGAAPTIHTIARPAAVLDGTDYFSRLLLGRVAVTYPGHDPTLQFLSPRDLAGAIAALIAARRGGTFNVAPKAGVPLRGALQLAGATRMPIPRKAQKVARSVTSQAGLGASAAQAQFIQYSWTVSGNKLRSEVGFEPALSSAAAIVELKGGDPLAPTVPTFDDFGMDPEYIRRYSRHLFKFLHDYYWRVEIDGIEHVPLKGRGVLVGVHRGFMPFDGVMTLHALVTQRGRIPRFLIHPSLTKFPFLADFMAKLGGIMACQENGDYVLEHDELLGVFPEGIRGAFTMYKRAYMLGKFGRDEFVRMALRNRAPLLPFVTVGSAEIYPILKRVDWKWFKRYTEWPFLPITPAPFPLPSKWHTRFLPAMHIEEQYGPEAAEDTRLVHAISLEVRQRMQAAIDEMLLQRRSIFAGSIFPAQDASVRKESGRP